MAILILAAACGERQANRPGSPHVRRADAFPPQQRGAWDRPEVHPPVQIGLERPSGYDSRDAERH
jgi:hypothetical protein